ncbi:hypothetical protein B0H67DRAFT_558311 [Lasiosphaeris hirsuta]|uniref:Uncharacterized protein n=1 Tax=Lasiosphaeris hirsuta TaxID=260670 RepID=A0AA39ZS53_9PEZI|nr:hypothetical protein B0H67DRAFT_558311 [Lasiosphaeris hirsuta]
MRYKRSRQPKTWRSEKQKLQRSYNCRKETLIKSLIAINKLPNTRFGLYGEHDGKWIKFEPDETFSLDTGVTVQAHENFGPRYIESSLSQLFREPSSQQPGYLINLTEDIFGDSPVERITVDNSVAWVPQILQWCRPYPLDPSKIEQYRQLCEETPEPEPLEAEELHDVWQYGNQCRLVPPKLSDNHKAGLVDPKCR